MSRIINNVEKVVHIGRHKHKHRPIIILSLVLLISIILSSLASALILPVFTGSGTRYYDTSTGKIYDSSGNYVVTYSGGASGFHAVYTDEATRTGIFVDFDQPVATGATVPDAVKAAVDGKPIPKPPTATTTKTPTKSSTASAEVAKIAGTAVPESRREKACEVHLQFQYDLPADPSKWTLDHVLVSGSSGVYQFVDRVVALKQSRPIYVHAFTSYEGSTQYNQALAQKRAETIVNIMRGYIKSKNLPDITVNVVTGTIDSKSQKFWTLSAAEMRTLDKYPRAEPDKTKRAQVYQSLQALKENRRAVLTLDENAYSIIQLGGASSVFLDQSCPATPPMQCNNGILEPNEQCDPKANPAGCPSGQSCLPDCKCSSANNQTCLLDKVKSATEDCDPTANPTGCTDGKNCTSDCKCAGKDTNDTNCFCLLSPLYDLFGMDTCGMNSIARIILCWWPLLFLLPLVYKMRRTHSKPREVKAGEIKGEEICSFLKNLRIKKIRLIEIIRTLEENIAIQSPELKKTFADYVKNFRDVAYLRDRTSQESLLLEKLGKELEPEDRESLKSVFEDYLKIITLLLELEELEATLASFVKKLREGVTELLYAKTNYVLTEMGITLNEKEAEYLEKEVIPVLETESRVILEEAAKIEMTLEEHVKEMGLALSGIVSLLGKGRWENKFKQHYGEHGEEALNELWWVKKNLRFHAPIYTRGEIYLMKPEDHTLDTAKGRWRTGERHIWPFRTEKHRSIYKYLPFGKWDHDKQITTDAEKGVGTEEEMRWRARLREIWGVDRDITAKSAYIQRFGYDIVKNVELDFHILRNLFRIEVIGSDHIGNLQQLAELKGLREHEIEAKGLQYGGALKQEIKALEALIKILCVELPPPPGEFTVKIHKPAPDKRKFEAGDINTLLKSKEEFLAKITGGKAPYYYIWHWGKHAGDTITTVEDNVDGNLFLTGKTDELVLEKISKGKDVILPEGYKVLVQRAGLKSKQPFDKEFCVHGRGERFLLHVTVKDSTGRIAYDHVIIEVKGKNFIEGIVVEHDHPEKPVEGATVWVECSSLPGGTAAQYTEDGRLVTATSGKDGRFRIEGTFRYKIIVHARKDAPEGEGKHTDSPPGRPNSPFDIPEGQREYKDVIVPIKWKETTPPPPPPPPPPPDEVIIKGRVVRHDNPEVGVEGATVWVTHKLTPDGKEEEFKNDKGKRLTVKSDKEGYFTIKGAFKLNVVVHAAKKKVEGKHIDEKGRPDKPFDCPPGRDDVIVPLKFSEETRPKVLSVPNENPRLPHPPQRGATGRPQFSQGMSMTTPDEDHMTNSSNANVSFMLKKTKGKIRVGWVCFIHRVSDMEVMNPKDFNLRVLVVGKLKKKGKPLKNPHTYATGKYFYDWFDAPEEEVETLQVTFNPYFDIPQNASPGQYRIVLELSEWPAGWKGMFVNDVELNSKKEKTRNLDTLNRLDSNYIEFMITTKPLQEAPKPVDGPSMPGVSKGGATMVDKGIKTRVVLPKGVRQ